MVNGGNGEEVEGRSSTKYYCYSCGHSWLVHGTGLGPLPNPACPQCGSLNTGTSMYKDDEPDWK